MKSLVSTQPVDYSGHPHNALTIDERSAYPLCRQRALQQQHCIRALLDCLETCTAGHTEHRVTRITDTRTVLIRDPIREVWVRIHGMLGT